MKPLGAWFSQPSNLEHKNKFSDLFNMTSQIVQNSMYTAPSKVYK